MVGQVRTGPVPGGQPRQTRASGVLAGVVPSVLILSENAGVPLCSGREENVLPVSVEYPVSLMCRIWHQCEGRGE